MLLFTPYGLVFSLIMAIPPLVYVVLALVGLATARRAGAAPSPDAGQAALRLSSSALHPTCVAALNNLRATDVLDADEVASLATGALVHAWQAGALEVAPAWGQAASAAAAAGAATQAAGPATLDFDATRLALRHEPTDPVDAAAASYLMPPLPAAYTPFDIYRSVVRAGQQHGRAARAFSAAVHEACVAQGLAEEPTPLQRLLSSRLELAIRIWAIVGIIATLLSGLIVFVAYMVSATAVLGIRQGLTPMGEAARADLAAVLARPEEAARAVRTTGQLAWLVEAVTAAKGGAAWETVAALCRAADPELARGLGCWCAESASSQFADVAPFAANLSSYFSSARAEADRD